MTSVLVHLVDVNVRPVGSVSVTNIAENRDIGVVPVGSRRVS